MNDKPLVLHCDFELLGSSEREGWLAYLNEWVANAWRPIQVVEGSLPNLGECSGDFAFICSSATLSRKLVSTLDRIFLRPSNSVGVVDSWLFSRLLEPHIGWHPQSFDVSLISSIYSGDEFIDGFLENSSSFENYGRCQHFLVRAGSPGSELEKLVGYAQKYPNAVLINLHRDPGLYEVWNYAGRLSTAKYVSNANLDDRRAPQQTRRLVDVLEANPKVDIVSSALRVSRVKNLRWEDSAECEVWPKDDVSGLYTGSDLFRTQGGALKSRNLPHCMPVWRRTLHAVVGDFDEKLYGPSADWAFWLKASTGGAGFYFDAEPLGLYLKSEAGYWQRHLGDDPESRFDERIAQEFGGLVSDSSCLATGYPFGLQLALVARRIEAGATLEGLGYLLEVSSIAEGAEQDLGILFGHHHFGIGFNRDLLATYGDSVLYDRASQLFEILVGLIHSLTPSGTSNFLRNLSFACADWFECESEQVGLMLMALLSKRCGDELEEKRLVQAALELGEQSFWSCIQTVYRFERSATDLASLVDGCEAGSFDKPSVPLNLYCYPNVTGNEYLSLLYARVNAEPNQIHFLSRAGQIPLAEKLDGFENIIHVHWINELVKPGVTDSEREAFLKLLLERKSSGFQIYWTIHNYLSHACVDQVPELAFRRALYTLADKVFVHHPLAADLLDWLPDRSKLAVCEHGPIARVNPDHAEVVELKNRLGLSDTGFVLSCIGQVKPYKGLMKLLPTIYELLVELPKFQFVLAGRIADKEVQDWLSSHSHPRLIVLDNFLDERELECLMLASDAGLLSYKNILTSGALFHWLSLGRPVLGPRMGLIPPYVVDGWNGGLYESAADLAGLIRRLSSGDKSLLKDMTKNSATVADRLVWGRVH